MKVSELRIGNLLRNNGVNVTIDARSIFDIWDDKGLKKYDPIPLTEECLLRLGFIRSTNYSGTFSYHIMNEDGFTSDFTIEYWNHGKWKDYWFIRQTIKPHRIKSVHQLQNLYFALSGKELKTRG